MDYSEDKNILETSYSCEEEGNLEGALANIHLYVPCSIEFFELQRNRRLRLNYDSGLITPTLTPRTPRTPATPGTPNTPSTPKLRRPRRLVETPQFLVSGSFEYEGGFSYWEKNYNDIIVIPSLSLNIEELQKIDGINHYEERSLFNLILLRRPETRIIYVTSEPLDSSIVEYYWKLLPGHVPFSQIRHRLMLLSTYDSSPKPLTAKILERPRLIDRLRSCIRDPTKGCLTCFNSSPYEVTLSRLLGIPLMGTDIPHLFWGTKQGSRRTFRDAGVPHPPGVYYSIRDIDTLAKEICTLHQQNSYYTKFMIKLNEGFSGTGNASLDLQPLLFGERDMLLCVKEHLKTLRFCSKSETFVSFIKKIEDLGCIVEVYFENVVSSPSFQGCLDHSGKITLLSTHEQILDPEEHQVYQGCSFPAHKSYRIKIQEYGRKIGEQLAKRGVTDHYGVDFIVFHPPEMKIPPDQSDWEGCEVSAIEINLRQGGTTHPMMTLKLLTGGLFHEESGTFRTLQNKEKYYVASDNISNPLFKGLLPHDIMEYFLGTRLHYSHTKEKGIVFHLLGALSQYGKIGFTAIGDSPEEAADFYEQTLQQLHKVAEDTLQKRDSISQLLMINTKTQQPEE